MLGLPHIHGKTRGFLPLIDYKQQDIPVRKEAKYKKHRVTVLSNGSPSQRFSVNSYLNLVGMKLGRSRSLCTFTTNFNLFRITAPSCSETFQRPTAEFISFI